MSDDAKAGSRSGFTEMPDRIFSDTRLSAEARGLLAFILSTKVSESHSATETAKIMRMGRDKYRRCIRELRRHGYPSNKKEIGAQQ